MDINERTRDIFEQIEAYPKPPLIPLPEAGDFSTLIESGVKPGKLSFGITRVALFLIGYKSFKKQLPDNLEHLLRTCNLRGAGLFSLIVSASLALEDDPRNLTAIERAATLLFAARNLHDDLWSGNLAPDRHRDQILEMGQYPNLFSTSLIVEDRKSRLYKSKTTEQITVLIDGRIYVLEVGALGKDTSIDLLIQTLEDLKNSSQANPRLVGDPAPGLLTCASHATQVPIFSQLQLNETNKISLNFLRNSFITICLDFDQRPTDYAEAALFAQSTNLENRWQHSSFQIVVFGNARAASICNFNAYVDGNVMMRGAAEVQRRATQVSLDLKPKEEPVGIILVKELPWQIPPEMIEAAKSDIKIVIDDQQATFELQGIGTDLFATHEVNPISAFILALAMTARQLIGEVVEICQFMTMSRYRCMDLVTANMTSPEVVQFVEYMQGKEVDFERAKQFLELALKSQTKITRESRASLKINKILALFIHSKSGILRKFTSLAIGLTRRFLQILGLFKQPETDIVISHPSIYPEVPVVGRPGIRLPYVKFFGLHYQIMADKTVVTIMPALDWPVPNQELIAKLSTNLKSVYWVLSGKNLGSHSNVE